MQKVYLLLRSNQQTGPYSLEELVQFDLKPYDLIWIEGRSAGWYYPQEITALQPYLSFLKPPPSATTPTPIQSSAEKPSPSAGHKHVFVSMPSNTGSEEPTPKPSFFSPLEKPTQASSATSFTAGTNEAAELKTTYAKSLEEVETDYMNWAYQSKKAKRKTVSGKGVLVACLLVGATVAGWALLQPANERTTPAESQQTSVVPPNKIVAETEEETTSPLAIEKPKVGAKQITGKKLPAKRAVVIATEDAPPEEKQPYAGPPTVSNEPVVDKPEIITEEKTDRETASAEPPAEKKKLRDKIADLFRKKPNEKKEEAKPAETENGERKSVRREASANLAQMLTVRFDVPNDWMMGIKGAKATLTNRSGEILVKAMIEVVYYNDDGDQLDKRTLSFANIKPKQTQTVSVPDHQTATRLEYNVISATGAGEPFAKR